MISGHPVHPHHFQTEVQDEFMDRFVNLNPSPENDSLRDILSSIFIRCEATVESLLGHAFFQSIELIHAPQRIKLQSVEKGFVKNSMVKAEEFRSRRRELLVKRDEAIKEEREKQVKEVEEAEQADEIVTKRRNKSMRRSSTGSSNGGGSIRRRSLHSGTQNTNSSTKESSDVLTNTSSPLYSENSTPPPPPPPPAPVPVSSEPSSSSSGGSAAATSSIPPQYQKLLNIGLSQDVVSVPFPSSFFYFQFRSNIKCFLMDSTPQQWDGSSVLLLFPPSILCSLFIISNLFFPRLFYISKPVP